MPHKGNPSAFVRRFGFYGLDVGGNKTPASKPGRKRETRKTGLDLFSVCPSFVVWSGVATSPLKPFSPTWISFRWFGFGWSGRGQLRPPRIEASNRSLETKEGAEVPRWCENSESAVQSLWKALEEVLGRPSDGSACSAPMRDGLRPVCRSPGFCDLVLWGVPNWAVFCPLGGTEMGTGNGSFPHECLWALQTSNPFQTRCVSHLPEADRLTFWVA